MMCHIVTRAKEPDEIKERVIHTRVPESLETELRKRAENLGMSVSNLVRNVLGHAFGLVGDVVADSHAVARAAKGVATARVASVEDVLAWQAMVLAKNAVCAQCNELLPKGSTPRSASPSTAARGDRLLHLLRGGSMMELVRMLKHLGTRLDAMSLDLARDAGAIVRNAQALGRCRQRARDYRGARHAARHQARAARGRLVRA